MHVGGHVEEGEFFDESLKREIKEEVNLNVEVIDLTDFKPRKIQNHVILKQPFYIHGKERGHDRIICLDYLCIAKKPVNVKILESEITGYKWIEKKEVNDLQTTDFFKELAHKAFEIYKIIVS